MSRNAEWIQLVLAWTLVGAFVLTVALTVLSLPGWIRFADRQQQKKLFYALIVELIAGTVAWFLGYIRLDAREVARTVEDRTKLTAGIESVHEDAQIERGQVEGSDLPPRHPWSSENPAATASWAVLQQLQGLAVSFRAAAKFQLGNLPYHALAESSEQAHSRARSLAIEIDHAYRVLLRARYESNVSAAQATDALAAVLDDPARSVVDLALETDRLYRFVGESSPLVGE